MKPKNTIALLAAAGFTVAALGYKLGRRLWLGTAEQGPVPGPFKRPTGPAEFEEPREGEDPSRA